MAVHLDTFNKDLKTIPLVAAVHKQYPHAQEVGKYITMNADDTTWQFSFNHGKVVSGLGPLTNDYRRLKTCMTTVDLDVQKNSFGDVVYSEKYSD